MARPTDIELGRWVNETYKTRQWEHKDDRFNLYKGISSRAKHGHKVSMGTREVGMEVTFMAWGKCICFYPKGNDLGE